MGAKADHDLWGQALAFETQYGDKAPEVIAAKIEQFREAGDTIEAGFWQQVAECLTELHAIRYPGTARRAGTVRDPSDPSVAPAPDRSPPPIV